MGRLGARLGRVREALRTDADSVAGPPPAEPTPEPASGGAPERPAESRLEVPIGVERAAAWSWRVLIIGFAGYVLYRVLAYFSEITVPIAVAVLLTALGMPLVDVLQRFHVPRVLATFVVLLGGIAIIAGVLTLVGQQVVMQVADLRNSVADGIGQIHDWLRDGPLGVTDEQLSELTSRAQRAVQGDDGEVVKRATELGSRITHVATGTFIVLFATFFFMYDGVRIWGFVVRLFPSRARGAVDSSAKAAWGSLTAFVRGIVLVAFVDALGIALSAYLLGVPLALAIGALVFFASFVPIVGAFVSGIVAVLVALVDQGLVTALLMMAAVIVVQQIESNVLQPFLMGKIVSVHPLAVILAISAGITISGVVGALVAVPTVACANAVVRHLANRYGDEAEASTSPASAPARN